MMNKHAMFHMSRDYSEQPGAKKLGIVNPRPIMEGMSMMVVGECGTVCSAAEACNEALVPSAEEIAERAAEVREKWTPGERRYRMTGIFDGERSRLTVPMVDLSGTDNFL